MGIGLSIAGGFGNRLSEFMRDKEKFDWENKRAERKFGMTTGQLGVAKAEEKAGIAVDKVKYLKSRGLTSLNLRYAFDKQSVGGIDMLYNEVLQGSEKATPEQLNRLMSVSKDFAAVDNRPWEEVFKEAYQIYATPEKDRLATNEQKEKKNFWSSMLADPSTTSGYDDGQRYGGYTRADQDRIIMSSTTTPRGSGILKLNTEARVNALDSRDYKSYEALAKTSFLNKQTLLENSFANLKGDVTLPDGRRTLKSVAAQSQYTAWVKAGDWDSITDTYGDSLLSSYLEQERLEIGSITNNMAVDENIRGWVGRKLNEPPFDPIEAFNNSIESMLNSVKNKSQFTKIQLENLQRFDSRAAALSAKENGTLREGESFTFLDTTKKYVLMDAANLKPVFQNKKLDGKEVITPTDEQFIAFAPSYVSADNTERQLEVGRRIAKVLLGSKDIEYTFSQYNKMSYNKAERLGLPPTEEGWDAAPAHRWLIETDKEK